MQQSSAVDTRRKTSKMLIVDDHPLYSDALASALEFVFEDCLIRKTVSLQQTFETLDDGFDPDLVMFDLKLPDVAGISGFQKLRKRLPDTQVLVISSLASVELVQSLLDEGAAGFLPKDSSAKTLKFAVSEITSGREYVPKEYRRADDGGPTDQCPFQDIPELASLTPQQIRILKLICLGKPNKLIAYELSLAEATVKAHITALLRRLGVRNRTQAVVRVEGILARQSGTEPEARAFLQH